jgi:hypothetical protein
MLSLLPVSIRSLRFLRVVAVLLLSGALLACSGGARHLPDQAPQTGDDPMLWLNAQNLPRQAPVVRQLKHEYYDCGGLVSEWFLKLLVAETNFLEKEEGLITVDGTGCAVSRAINQGQTEPRFTVHLFNTRKEANECVVNSRCEFARNVTLVPREGAVWRSYFLTDYEWKRFYQHCLAPQQRWYPTVVCDVVLAEGT